MPHAREFAKKIGEQARRTKELVSDLLKFGRQAKPQKELVDLNSIVENAVELRKLDINGDVEITQQLDPALPMVNADPSQMLQVCFDIVGNALEAVHQVGGGTLSIRSWTQDGSAHLQFKDSGPGVKNPTKIFDPFYTTKPVGHGTGLGLSAAYGIVREHGGVISCESDGESGATFKIMLPAYIHEPAPALAAHAVAAQ
jgi:two-component system NtrC family sensor kinase